LGARPVVTDGSVIFTFADANFRLIAVRLRVHAVLPEATQDFTYAEGIWTLRLKLPSVQRLEYLIELAYPDGRRELIPDPANPHRVSGVFGEKSVIEVPDYRPPAWLDYEGVSGTRTPLSVRCDSIAATIRGERWAPDLLPDEEAAPLVIVHDGPEYDRLGRLIDWAAGSIAAERLPPFRIALLAPGDRNRWYAADPRYATALVSEVIPTLALLSPASCRIGLGASLGALALLHAHQSNPGSFDALFLQSGSFFTPDLDPQEREFSRFESITRFTAELGQAITYPEPLPVVLTCGLAEENLANNRHMATMLRHLGYPCQLVEVPDAHNYTGWRDAWDPHLNDLISELRR
jgi:enterochelin esterase family protein